MRARPRLLSAGPVILACLPCMALPLDAALSEPLPVGSVAGGTSTSSYTADQKAQLTAVRTVLVGIEASTAETMGDPLYDIVIAVKLRLEASSFHVVLDPREQHDAVLLIEYQETPGREYPNLEVGTKISCRFLLYHPGVGKVREYAFEAESSWPRPFGSLYWDAVQELEENPVYYYLGPLIRGWLTSQRDVIEVFSAVLREPPLTQSLDGSDNVLTSEMAANQNARLHAIKALGRSGDRRALETLWHLVWQSRVTEGRAALAAIGQIADPGSWEPLKDLATMDGPLRSAASSALRHVESRMRPAPEQALQ